MREIEVRSSGERVEASSGDRIVIEIPENATTGYRWVVGEVPDALRLAEDEFVPPGSQQPGAGGQRRVTLVAEQPGEGTIALRLEQPWVGEAADLFEAHVTVW
jgi:inhibitor of cysteine peptidase